MHRSQGNKQTTHLHVVYTEPRLGKDGNGWFLLSLHIWISLSCKHKTFVYHFYNVGPTSKTLYKCFTNVLYLLGYCVTMSFYISFKLEIVLANEFKPKKEQYLRTIHHSKSLWIMVHSKLTWFRSVAQVCCLYLGVCRLHWFWQKRRPTQHKNLEKPSGVWHCPVTQTVWRT